MLLLRSLLICFLLTSFAHSQITYLEWSKSYDGANNHEIGESLAVDDQGNVYVLGLFKDEVNFGTASNPEILTSTSDPNWDLFLTKHDKNGNFIWVKSFTIDFSSQADPSICISSDNSIYISYYFTGTVDFDPGNNVYDMTASGTEDIFVLKLTNNGEFEWAFQLNPDQSNDNISPEISTYNNELFLTSHFKGSMDMDPSAGYYPLSTIGTTENPYVSKFSVNGEFIWAKVFSSTIQSLSSNIATTSNGDIVCTGWMGGILDCDPSADEYNLDATTWMDTYVIKLDNDGNFIWAGKMGGEDGLTHPKNLSIGTNDDILVSGYYRGKGDFNPGADSDTLYITAPGDQDIFMVKLETDGTHIWAKNIALTVGYDYFTTTLDKNGDVYLLTSVYQPVAEDFPNNSIDFDPNADTYYVNSSSTEDIVLSKYDTNGEHLWLKQFGVQGNNEGLDLFVDDNLSIYFSGTFLGSIDMDASADSHILSSNSTGNYLEAYITRYSHSSASLVEISKNSLKLWPNPTQHSVNIRFASNDPAHLIVRNIAGEQVFMADFSNDYTVNTEQWSNGIYFFEIISNTAIVKHKVIKQ